MEVDSKKRLSFSTWWRMGIGSWSCVVKMGGRKEEERDCA